MFRPSIAGSLLGCFLAGLTATAQDTTQPLFTRSRGKIATSTTVSNTGEYGAPAQADLDRYQINRRWFAQLPVLRLREHVKRIKYDSGMVYAQTTGGVLHGIEASSGKVLWSTKVAEEGEDSSMPAQDGDHLFVAVTKELAVLNKQTGRITDRQPLPSPVLAEPSVNRDHIYVTGQDNRIYALSRNMDQTHKFQKWPVQWYYQTAEHLNTRAALFENEVVILCANGTLYGFAPSRRQVKFRYVTGSPAEAPLGVKGNTVFIGGLDSRVYAVSMPTGEGIWNYRTGYAIHNKPVPIANELYVTTEGGGMFVFKADKGTVIWHNPQAAYLLSASQTHVFALDNQRRMLIFNRKDGSLSSTWPVDHLTIGNENQIDDRIFLASPEGMVVCMHEAANAEPFVHPLAEAPAEKADTADDGAKAKKKKKAGFDDEEEKEDGAEEGAAKKKKPGFDDEEKEESK